MKNYIFILLTLTTSILIACDSGLHKQREKKYNPKKQIELANSIQKNRSSPLKRQAEKNLKEKAKKQEKWLLITSLKKQVQKVISSVNQDKINIKANEPPDQFGMKNGTFKIIMGNPSQQTYNSPEGQENRRQFYSSLNYDKEKIRKFGIILNKITLDNVNRGQLHTNITNAGRYHSQFQFERIINKIKEVQDKLNYLDIKDLRTISIKLEEIEMLKTFWQTSMNNLIKEYEDNQYGIQTDSQKLIEHVKEKYANILQKEIPKIDTLANDINKILKVVN
ncbi:Antigen P35 (plasmid) [Borrelia miyamotoi FR64b]|uniref:complement regulator-acquiring protein n=1 Tax=Borrelia miyamotoi TaxID=47466 RepID=UPI0003E3F567|nr:complement regulator-acquiring protein [Borrelia miyamotoi]AHH05426.1 Antigen P35 [Borrelia miyamotoi FR64b]WAZ70962.1 complement regulator-acquiring protein [Borrelia miyamotoi]